MVLNTLPEKNVHYTSCSSNYPALTGVTKQSDEDVSQIHSVHV